MAAAPGGKSAAAKALPTKRGMAARSSGSAAGGPSALRELIVVGNPDLPDAVDDAVAAWKTRQWVKEAGLR